MAGCSRLRRAKAGSRAYVSHAIDMIRRLTGREISDRGGAARTERATRPDDAGKLHPSTAEDALSAWFALDGCTVSLDSAAAASVAVPERMVVFGHSGALELDGTAVRLRHPDGRVEDVAVPGDGGSRFLDALTGLLGDVRDGVAAGCPASPDFNDGVAAAEVMDRLRDRLVRV